MTISRILTNKTVITGLENSLLVKEASLFKPVFGDASKMGKVVKSTPMLKPSKMQGGFKADLNATLKITPDGLKNPFYIGKKFA